MSNENAKLTLATVVYLIDKDNRVCLARMNKAIHKDKSEQDISKQNKAANNRDVKEQEQIEYSLGVWNGYGGKETDEDIEYARANNIADSMLYTAVRELEEESGVEARMEDLEKCGVVNFYIVEKTEYDVTKQFTDYDISNKTIFMQVHFYTLRKWIGNPMESKEMGPPVFFEKVNIPYHDMMPNDKMLLGMILESKRIDSNVILFGKGVEPVVEFML